jgi:hypothetical protein
VSIVINHPIFFSQVMVTVMNNETSLCTFALVSLLSISQAQAVEPKDISDMLDERAMSMVGQFDDSAEARMQSCNSDNTSVVTIYTTTGKAQVGIDVKIDGRVVGSLTSHYPDEEPSCNTDGSAGVITLVVPAGEHMLDAKSLNLFWPAYTFEVETCECRVLPLH